MKRIILILLSIVFAASIFSIQPVTANADNKIWVKEYYKDKFGDPTETFYIANESRFTGTYTSDTVEDGPLEVLIITDEDGLYFVLYEDGKRVKYPGLYSIDIKTSEGELLSLIGHLNEEENRIVVDAAYELPMINALATSDVISIYIEQQEAGRSYVFKVPCSNFDSIYEKEIEAPIKEPLYQEALELLKENNSGKAYLVFSDLGNYKDSQDKADKLLQQLDGPGGLFLLASEYYLGKNNREIDYDIALGLYKKSAELGDSTSMWSLGYIYSTGVGAEKDFEKAVQWYEKAAEHGETDALLKLGKLYFVSMEGRDSESDYKKAYEWYLKAADQGLTDAYFPLGYMCEYGLGLEVDQEQALEWYKKAAALGDIPSIYSLGHLYIVMGNEEESFTWYKKAADLGYDRAMIAVGLMYDGGIGVDMDYEEAFTWYSRAAEQGNTDAIEYIQNMVDSGHIDESRASKWLS